MGDKEKNPNKHTKKLLIGSIELMGCNLHSRAPRMVPLPELGSSFNFGVFVCVKSECGSNMDTKEFCSSLDHSVFQQHIDSCFQCLSDKYEQNGNGSFRMKYHQH